MFYCEYSEAQKYHERSLLKEEAVRELINMVMEFDRRQKEEEEKKMRKKAKQSLGLLYEAIFTVYLLGPLGI